MGCNLLLFDPSVKTRPEDFYNYNRELETLLKGIKDPLTRMIVIKGIRRIGKSSLLRVALELTSKPYILFDVRSVGDVTVDNIYKVLSTGLQDAISRLEPFKELLSRIEGIEIAGVKVKVKDRKPSILYEILNTLNQIGTEKGHVIVAIDEAHHLTVIRGLPRILAHAYDYLKGVKLILTGSEIGLLDRLLGRKNPDAPLYGRPTLEITMKRLPREKSIDFLKHGFKELDIHWPIKYIEEAVDKLDGIPGWLTYYGYHAHTTNNHTEALTKTIETGSTLVAKELETFLAVRRIAKTRYLAILRCLKSTPMKWSMLRRCMEAETGTRITNPQLYRYLKELQDYTIIEKNNNQYQLTDPLLKEALDKIK